MRPPRRALSYLVFVLVHTNSFAAVVDPKLLDSCPGYKATDVQTRPNGLSAQLVLGEKPCNVFGDDIYRLSLNVVYETGMLYDLFNNLSLIEELFKTTEYMSRSQMHLFLDTRFQSLFFLGHRVRVLPRQKLQSLLSITRHRRSLSPSTANPHRRYYSQRHLIQLSSNLSTSASKLAFLLMPIFMGWASTHNPSISPQATQR